MTLPVKLLTVCKWKGRSMESTETLDPTWEQVEAAIRALDEHARNDLFLLPDPSNPETYLCVGGGSGRYLVTGSIDNERFPTATANAGHAEGRERLVVGGQTGDYPRSYILDLDLALRATRSFFETSEFGGGGVTWIDA